MNKGISGKLGLIVSLVLVGLFVTQSLCFAKEDDDKNRPERLVMMAVEYPGVMVAKDEDVSMDVIFYNKGKKDENIDVWIDQIPEGWQAKVKTYRFDVSGVHVPSGDNKNLTFEAQPDEITPPGKYEFRISAKTPYGLFKMSQTVMVTIKEGEPDKKESKGVKLTTSYPVIRGPSDATFEFSLEVDSKLDEDAVFDLSAQGPKGWDLNFKPAYETKYITSLRIKSKQSTTVAVEVKPAIGAEAGEYPINIRVSSGDAKAESALMVILRNLWPGSGNSQRPAVTGSPSGQTGQHVILCQKHRVGCQSQYQVYVV